MAKTRRRLRNENAHLRAEVARLQAQVRELQNPPKRPRYVRETPFFSGGGISNSTLRTNADLLSFAKSRVVMAENGTIYTDAVGYAELNRIQASLNKAIEDRLFGLESSPTPPAQGGESSE